MSYPSFCPNNGWYLLVTFLDYIRHGSHQAYGVGGSLLGPFASAAQRPPEEWRGGPNYLKALGGFICVYFSSRYMPRRGIVCYAAPTNRFSRPSLSEVQGHSPEIRTPVNRTHFRTGDNFTLIPSDLSPKLWFQVIRPQIYNSVPRAKR